MGEHIFVYGTLLFDDIVRMLTGRRLEAILADLDNHARYLVVHDDEEPSYPAIVREPGSSVAGRVLLNVDERSAALIDRYENTPPEYERITVAVQLADRTTMEAVTYRALPILAGRLGGPWSQQKFAARWLPVYLNRRIPHLLEQIGAVNCDA